MPKPRFQASPDSPTLTSAPVKYHPASPACRPPPGSAYGRITADSFVNHAGTSKPVAVPVTTLDRIAGEFQPKKLDMVKADGKGGTERALNGGKLAIGKFHPRLVLATAEPPEYPAQLTAPIARLFPSCRAVRGNCLILERGTRTDVMFHQ